MILNEDSEFKQVLVVRMDLGMGRGKIAVQCSHAAVSSADVARSRFPKWYDAWMREGQKKIAVKIGSFTRSRARGSPARGS